MDAVSLIIDAHLSLLLLTPSLHVRLEALQTKINEYQRVSNLMERLRGCVALFNDASSSQKGPRASAEVAAGMVAPSKKKKQLPPQKPLTKHRQRWNRMVSDLHDGVESYNIEEFVL